MNSGHSSAGRFSIGVCDAPTPRTMRAMTLLPFVYGGIIAQIGRGAERDRRTERTAYLAVIAHTPAQFSAGGCWRNSAMRPRKILLGWSLASIARQARNPLAASSHAWRR